MKFITQVFCDFSLSISVCSREQIHETINPFMSWDDKGTVTPKQMFESLGVTVHLRKKVF